MTRSPSFNLLATVTFALSTGLLAPAANAQPQPATPMPADIVKPMPKVGVETKQGVDIKQGMEIKQGTDMRSI